MARSKRTKLTNNQPTLAVETYSHTAAEAVLRPDIGTQAQFKKKKSPKTYSYDSSLSPALDFDGQNPARERAEQLIAALSQHVAALDAALAAADPKTKAAAAPHTAALRHSADQLKALSKPFLNWAGKAERLSFDVPTLPLFVHERLSTKAIIETLKAHKRDQAEQTFLDLFGDPQQPIHDQILKAYEHKHGWTNRMMLGDSLVLMNSLLEYEGMGGQVQMIYMDPPYGVKFGSNFQPFVRKRDVKHNEDEDMTREPEMVKAYRDTWECGLHSYLTYMRDRLLLSKELLHPSGSIFVQISDENVHHVRELMDEVFGTENFCALISFKKTSGLGSTLLQTTQDFLLWYARRLPSIKFRQLFVDKVSLAEDDSHYQEDEQGRLFTLSDLTAQNNNVTSCLYTFKMQNREYKLPKGRQWKTTEEGLKQLVDADRVVVMGNSLRYKRYLDDFPVSLVTDTWHDLGGSVQSRTDPKIYVVQTGNGPIQRCILMTTDPGDLVLDPTCGSGTTAYVAEQWGRRWITMDVSRVPLALARQRLLTATFPWFDLKNESLGPAGGFVYKRKQNAKGEEIGGIVPHITLKSIANNEPPQEEILVDRPEKSNGITRVTGPFCFEATIPTPVDWEDGGVEDSGAPSSDEHGSFIDRMLEVLRRSPVLHLGGGKSVSLKNIRPPAKTLSLSAEAVAAAPPGRTVAAIADRGTGVNDPGYSQDKPVALVFGPESGAVSEKLVWEAAREAFAKNYAHLYVIGFAIQANARQLVEQCTEVVGIPATYVQATPDLMMGDLLKIMRSSQIFSVCGMPEIKIHHEDTKDQKKSQKGGDGEEKTYRVELLGLDVFDPVTMATEHRRGDDVPAWFLDTDYNGLCFHVCQAFFPRTAAWDNLKRALKAEYDESVWDHLSGTVSAPFTAGVHKTIAVKVIDDRGNELLVTEKIGT